jgi:pimeloyl-ACP methyl ester carboxylesterase
MLTAGRERPYLSTFFQSKTLNSLAFTEADIDEYAAIYSQPGAMRAGFQIYRAFAQDVADNRESMKEKLEIPVLAMGGIGSAGEDMMREQFLQAAHDVTAYAVPGSGHYVAEENPSYITQRLLEFL